MPSNRFLPVLLLIPAPDTPHVFLSASSPKTPQVCVCVHGVKGKHGAEVFHFGVSAVQTLFVKIG